MAADDDELDPRADPPDADRAQLGVYWRTIRKTLPGPWVSDHWNQTTKGFVGATYVTIDMLGRALGSATVNLMEQAEAPAEGEPGEVRRALSTPGFHESDERWRPADADHPARKIIDEPNPRQSIADVLYERTLQECLTGSSYTWVVPNGYGEPAEQYIIPTVLTTALPASADYPNGAYRVQPAAANGAYAVLPGRYAMVGGTIPAEQMVVDRRSHPWLSFDGYAPLEAAQTQLDVLRQIDIMRASAAQNGAEPSLVVIAPAGTKPEDVDRLQSKLDARFAGPWNHRKVMVITGGTGGTADGRGITVMPWSKGPGDLGGEATWDQLVGFVSALFGVPKVITGLADAGSYAEFYAALKQFYTRTLLPLAKRIAWRWTQQLLWPKWGKRFRYQIDLPAIDDREQRLAEWGQHAELGVVRVDEYRTTFGLVPLGGADGQKFVGQAAQEREAEVAEKNAATLAEGGAKVGGAGGAGGPPRPANADGKGSLPSRIGGAVKAMDAANGVLKAKDATGHEHAPPGSDRGGQFTSGGGGTATAGRKTKPGRSDQRTNQQRHEQRRAARVAEARAKALAKAKAAPKPTPEAAAEAGRRMDAVGADRYEADIRGNTTDRANSRKRLLAEFGDGETCPCVYCGLDLVDGDGPNLVTRDKIYVARQGGRYTHSNLVPACLDCNKQRSDQPFERFLKASKGS